MGDPRRPWQDALAQYLIECQRQGSFQNLQNSLQIAAVGEVSIVKLIILAGGGGTRLFPLSRSCFPKQFMKVASNQSLLVETARRFLPVVQATDMVIVTNENYLHYVKAELAASGLAEAHVILEPVGRNTAPAIALAVQYCQEILKAQPEEVLFVALSDHIVRQRDVFIKAVQQGEKLAQKDKLVTFGIVPDKPETGYGYIEAGENYDGGFVVHSFKEKPDLPMAKSY